jgi:peptide/nickel transport system substrate-binding protein
VIVNTVFYGYAAVSPSPISVTLPKFFDPQIRPHKVDLDLANRLLDEAGFPRKDGKDRFTLRLLFNPAQDKRLAEYFRQALRSIGIDAKIESYDFATYVKVVYADRAFDLTSENLNNAFDPTVGVQRVYWSKNFKVGLPFSNAAHYANREIDRLLEAAAREIDAAKRKSLFFDFQRVVADDLPAINTVAPAEVVVFNRRVKNFALGAEGLRRNFADTYLE